jgi:hypothetical protein
LARWSRAALGPVVLCGGASFEGFSTINSQEKACGL